MKFYFSRVTFLFLFVFLTQTLPSFGVAQPLQAVDPASTQWSSGEFVEARVIGAMERIASGFGPAEIRIFNSMGVLSDANAVLLGDCQTLITASHVSQDPGTGGLLPRANQFYLAGRIDQALEVDNYIYGTGRGVGDSQALVNSRDWNVLRLKASANSINQCQGVTPAFVSKERLQNLELYSYAFSTPAGVAVGDIANYTPTAHRACRLIDESEMSVAPRADEQAKILFHDCDTENVDSGHGIFTKIDGQFYLVGIHLGWGGEHCPGYPRHASVVDRNTPAEACPNQAKWIEGDFLRAIESSLGHRVPRFD